MLDSNPAKPHTDLAGRSVSAARRPEATTLGAFVMSEVTMTVTPTELAIVAIDQMLALVSEAKHQRRPAEWLEDRLLDMRLEVTA